MNILFEFDKKYKKIINPYIDFGENLNEIKYKIKDKHNIDLDKMNYELIKRETSTNFRMKYHRDNYMVRNIEGKFVFIPFSNSKISKFSLIWYKNEDFTGGSFQFINSKQIVPKKNMFIFFDSNQIHCVNKQLSGTRIIELYKFY
tara:strand:- start:1449 stop:1883 length:435 start_codon:yes stop_codon:yes gene_type:complete